MNRNNRLKLQPFEYKAVLRQQHNEACHKHYQSKGMGNSQIAKNRLHIGDVIFWAASCTGQGGYAVIDGFDDKYVYVHDSDGNGTLRWYNNIRLATPKQIEELNNRKLNKL